MATQSPPPTGAESWLQIVHQKVAGLRFGSVQIIIHDERVTQVESTEKIRFHVAVPSRDSTQG